MKTIIVNTVIIDDNTSRLVAYVEKDGYNHIVNIVEYNPTNMNKKQALKILKSGLYRENIKYVIDSIV